jgi:hypothetical protein
MRDAEHGSIVVEVVTCWVQTKVERRVMAGEELLFVTRQGLTDGGWKYDYHLSNAPAETPRAELARVANAEHRIEQCFQRGKSEAGMADYQTRSWWGWHHHQTLPMLAVWFLVQETRRGKKGDPGVDGPTGPGGVGHDPTSQRPRFLTRSAEVVLKESGHKLHSFYKLYLRLYACDSNINFYHAANTVG